MPGASFQIRAATPRDARRIAEIHVASWRESYRNILPDAVLGALSVDKREEFWKREICDETHHTLVAEESGRMTGWIFFGPCRDADAPSAAEIYGIYLDPGTFRRGVGRQLWSAAVKEIASTGHDRVAVWVLEANLPARRFYEAMGGVADMASIKQYERPGVSLPELRYWCPVRSSD